MPTRIIVDTDLSMGAGADVDDGFALALAHADPDLQLDMVTTVNGNTDIESATILTGILLDRLKVDPKTPFVRGASTPLIHTGVKRVVAPHVEALRKSARPPVAGRYAAHAIVEHIIANPGEITLVCIGPLTNVALALLLEPRVASLVKELVIMGGVSFGTMYSWNKPGEFNVFTDPEAARAVLWSEAPQRWISFDVTLQVRMTTDDADAMKASPSAFSQFAGEAAATYVAYQTQQFPGRQPRMTFVPMHDPLAVAVVSHPELCEYKDMAVNVEVGEGVTRGVMVGDRQEVPNPPPPNCRVAVSVDAEAFRSHFLSLIKGL
jgi:purine nucleosidase